LAVLALGAPGPEREVGGKEMALSAITIFTDYARLRSAAPSEIRGLNDFILLAVLVVTVISLLQGPKTAE
jgi:hypothetical protein